MHPSENRAIEGSQADVGCTYLISPSMTAASEEITGMRKSPLLGEENIPRGAK